MHHTGGCQCGAVRFEVDLSLDQTFTCNCSRCKRMGFVLAFAPRASFTLLQGSEALTEYLFNHRVIHHQFCRICGIESFALGVMPDGAEMAAININCLDGVDARALPSHAYDGASA